jgi:hypothetical protein
MWHARSARRNAESYPKGRHETTSLRSYIRTTPPPLSAPHYLAAATVADDSCVVYDYRGL